MVKTEGVDGVIYINESTDNLVTQPSAIEQMVAAHNGQFVACKRDMSPLATQVGGSHYKDFKIQPIEFINANNLDFLQGNIIKYCSRHKNKNGAEDVRKIIHYAQLILKLQYGVDE